MIYHKPSRNVRSTLASQISDFSQLRAQNGQLEEELQQLEARLRNVERLKKELEQVRAAREAQEAKLAKVRREVQTVGREIDRITKALEEKFGKSLVVTQHQDRLVLTMLGQVLFESGKAQLTPLGLDIMKKVGEVLALYPTKIFKSKVTRTTIHLWTFTAAISHELGIIDGSGNHRAPVFD